MTTRTTGALVLALALQSACVVDDIEHEDGESGGDADSDEVFPSRMAEAYCAALFACSPVETCWESGEPSPYATADECIAAERGLLEEVRTAARGAGLTYDPQCVDASIARYAAIGCDGQEKVEVRDEHLFDECPPYYGTIPEGENPCFEIVGSALTDCGQGLVCEDQYSCEDGAIETCDCEAGFVCSADQPQPLPDTCLPIVADGEECRDADYVAHSACSIESYCEPHWDDAGILLSATCQPRQPNGTPCQTPGTCSSYSCNDDVCGPASPWLCSRFAAPRHWR